MVSVVDAPIPQIAKAEPTPEVPQPVTETPPEPEPEIEPEPEPVLAAAAEPAASAAQPAIASSRDESNWSSATERMLARHLARERASLPPDVVDQSRAALQRPPR